MFIKKAIGYAMYITIGSILPDMTCKIKSIARISKRFRAWACRMYLDKCGSNVNINPRAKFSSRVEIGDYSGIGRKSRICGKCIIGDYVVMGPEVYIYTVNHETSRIDIPIKLQGDRKEQVVRIGNDVWIGARVTILPGVTIGNGCVIGAGAVVAKDVPDYAVAVGNPAKVVKYRNEDNVIKADNDIS